MDWIHTLTIIGTNFAVSVAFFIYLMTRIDNLRSDMDKKFEDLRSDMDKKFEDLRSDMDKKFEDLRSDMDKKLDEIKDLIAPRKVILFKEPEREEPKEQ